MHPGIKQLVDGLKEISEPLKVDLSTHQPTDNELNNLCYLSCKYICGWSMRECDLAVVRQLGGNDLEKFKEALADYIWDHLMGEPDEISQEEVKKAVDAITLHLYGQPEDARNSV